MAERDRFELDLAAGLRAYLEDAPTEVRPTELARQFAEAYPHGRPVFGVRGLLAVPRVAWVLLLVGALLAALVGGALVAGSQLQRRLPAVVPPIGQLFECLPGSNPDKPGPVDQARPAGGWWATAFDRRAGRLVVVTTPELGSGIETSTFDVCTNTWTRMHPNQEPPSQGLAQIVYDVKSDMTIGVFRASVWAYDLQADSWTRKSLIPGTDALRFVAYDPVSGLVVAAGYHSRMPLWNYDIVVDTWTPIHQTNVGPVAFRDANPYAPYDALYGVAYDASVDRLVAYGNEVDGQSPNETWLFDIRTGTWAESRAYRDPFNRVSSVPMLVYDEAAQRTAILGTDPLTAYEASTDRWEILAEARTVGPTQMAYDSVNRRLVGWGAGGNSFPEGAVEALDLATGKWAVLLEPTPAQPTTGPE